MNIGVLGNGNIGRTLARKWAKAGHEVVFGVRNPDQKRTSPDSGDLANLVDFQTVGKAINASEVILFAVPSGAMPDIITTHSDEMDNKILIDATNDFSGGPASKVPELIASSPDSVVFRAFNSLGWEVFAKPQIGGQQADLFYCGPDDENARRAIEQLIAEIGLQPESPSPLLRSTIY